MGDWEQIREYITQPKFQKLCVNIAKKSGLSDDLYQELMLSLLEKIERKDAALHRSFTTVPPYIDWYIVGTAHRMFHGNRTVMNKYRWSYSNSTGFTDIVDTSAESKEQEEIFDSMLRLCEKELGEQYWYNKELLKQYVFVDESIRAIEKKTGIPRNSIHRTLKQTREALRKIVEEKMKQDE